MANLPPAFLTAATPWPRPHVPRPSRPALCERAPPCMSDVAKGKSAAPIRVGHGFDLHRLESGLPLILGGVSLPHDRGCAGHSDGDAVYHCVVDAVLGALSLPDIGQLFPDSDPRFKDCPSHVFMTAAYEKMRDLGYQVGNVDVTVILERPKMSPHKLEMRTNIARLLHAHLDDVNLKAKTHEKVDAVGENRAVSVHAVATLVRTTPDTGTFPNSAAAAVGTAVTKSLLSAVGQRVVTNMQAQASASSSQSQSSSSLSSSLSSCAVQRLYDLVQSRRGADATSSWTAKLFSKGRAKMAEKVGEEAVEVVIEAVRDDAHAVVRESADLLYHLTVLWADMGVSPDDVFDELAAREGRSGIAEKNARGAS